MSIRLSMRLISGILLCAIATSGIAEDDLRSKIELYSYSGDTPPDEDFRQTIQENEGEAKSVLMEVLENVDLSDHEIAYGRIAMLADLAWGMEDEEFDIEFWRRAVLKHKEYPFDFVPFFEDYIKRDPSGALETFQSLAEIGNENVREIAAGYIERLNSAPKRKFTNSHGLTDGGKRSTNGGEQTLTVEAEERRTDWLTVLNWALIGSIVIFVYLLFSILYRKSNSERTGTHHQ